MEITLTVVPDVINGGCEIREPRREGEGMKKKVLQPNVIKGYDEKGNCIMIYWQSTPIETRMGQFFSISRKLWWNPIWRFQQWRMRKTIITASNAFGITGRSPKRKEKV